MWVYIVAGIWVMLKGYLEGGGGGGVRFLVSIYWIFRVFGRYLKVFCWLFRVI